MINIFKESSGKKKKHTYEQINIFRREKETIRKTQIETREMKK